jgi:RNA polymerase sigma factor (sigma-70 family)
MYEQTEKTLAEGLRKKDSQSMELFYDRFAGLLTSVCSRYIPDDDDVRDVLQEALVKIYSKAGAFHYRGEGSLSAWASRIVANESLTYLRKKKPLPVTLELPDIPEDEVEEDLNGISSDVLLEMIRKLPQTYRTVFNLYVFEDLSHKEIGHQLGIKEDSSASNLLRARRLLQKEIEEYKKRQ